MKKVHHTQIDKWFMIAAVFLVAFVFWKIIEPFMLVIITAMAAGIVFAPIQHKLVEKIRSESIAATILSILLFLLVILPLLGLLYIIIRQVNDLVPLVTGIQISTDALPEIIRNQFASLQTEEINAFISDWVVRNVGAVFGSTADLLLNLFIFFIAFFYALVTRTQMRKFALEMSPLKDNVDQKIIQRVIETVRSVVFGSLLVALIQGIVATIGMIVLGLPGAVIWGTLTTVLAPIPIFGTAITMVPAAIYFFAMGNIVAGIVMLIWWVIVGMIYNVLAPKLIQRKTKMHSFLILISILGGLNLFGPIGFIVGPSVLAIVLALVELHRSGALK